MSHNRAAPPAEQMSFRTSLALAIGVTLVAAVVALEVDGVGSGFFGVVGATGDALGFGLGVTVPIPPEGAGEGVGTGAGARVPSGSIVVDKIEIQTTCVPCFAESRVTIIVIPLPTGVLYMSP